MVIDMEEEHSYRKGCVNFVGDVSSEKWKDVEGDEVLKKYHVFQQFLDVFPAEILELPPHREVDFSIELVPGETPTSNEIYTMGTLELV